MQRNKNTQDVKFNHAVSLLTITELAALSNKL